VSELRTAVSIVLDDARSELEAVRADFHARAVAAGIPLHVTLLFPFVPRARLEEGVVLELTRFFAPRPPFTLTLVGIRQFPGVVYALPEPDDTLRDCMTALWARFPDFPPYEGEFEDVAPHATLAEIEEGVSQEDVLAQIRERTHALFPLTFPIEDVALLEEHAADHWRERRRFRLGSP
jgi:2'-5' RNA ligase